MKEEEEGQQTILSLRTSPAVRRLVELLAAHLTIARGGRVTMTDVLEEAIREKAKKEGVKAQ
jgi:hypothetical protein